MIVSNTGNYAYNAVVLNVENRWYICSEAAFDYHYDHYVHAESFLYKTPTLKFLFTHTNGWNKITFGKAEIELLGCKSSLKLEYI